MQIYKTTNNINGKFYVGKDTRDNPQYLGSGTLLKAAMKKYGRENFSKEIIDVAETNENLCELEIYWINEFRKTNSNMMYNIRNGGEGLCQGEVSPAKGKKWSTDSKLKISNFLIERGAQSIETIEKRRKSLIGKKTFQPLYTQEGKTNISNSLKKSIDLFVQKKEMILNFQPQTQEIIKFYVEGLTSPEISDKLGITVQRIRSIIFTAKKQLLA